MDSRIDTKWMDQIIEAGEMLQDMDLVNTFEGNISIKQGDILYITPGRTNKKKLTYDNICIFDETTGKQLSGGRSSSETKMHRGAYAVKEGLHAAVHCHAPFLTAHAITHQPLDYKCHPELLFHFKDIPVVPYGMPGSDEIMEHAKPYLLTRNLVLLANHGVLCVASNMALCCQKIIAAEKFAKVMFIANLMGKPVDIPETEIYRLMGRELEL